MAPGLLIAAPSCARGIAKRCLEPGIGSPDIGTIENRRRGHWRTGPDGWVGDGHGGQPLWDLWQGRFCIPSEKGVESLERNPQGRLRQRKIGLRGGKLLPLLEHVECGRLAAPIAEERDIGELLASRNLLLDDRPLLSGGHRVQVCLGHLSGQGHRDGVAVSAAHKGPETTRLQEAIIRAQGREVVSRREPAGPRVEEGRPGTGGVTTDRQSAKLKPQPTQGSHRSQGVDAQRGQERGSETDGRSLSLSDALDSGGEVRAHQKRLFDQRSQRVVAQSLPPRSILCNGPGWSGEGQEEDGARR